MCLGILGAVQLSKAKDDWLAKAAASGVVKAISYHAATTALPFLLAAMTLIAGRLGDGASWMWSLMAASLAFGGSSAGFFYLFEFVGKRAIDGRLSCESPRVSIDIVSGKPCLGINLQSSADVPVEFEVSQIKTEVSGVYPQSKPFDLATFLIPPRGIGFFNDFSISVELKEGIAEVREGSVSAIVKYGKAGNRKYILEIKRKVHLRYSAEGNIEAVSWNEGT